MSGFLEVWVEVASWVIMSAFPRGASSETAGDAIKVKTNDVLFGSGTARLANIEEAPRKKGSKSLKKQKGEELEALEMSLHSRVGLGMVKTLSSKEMKIERVAPTRYQVGTLAVGFVLQLTGSKAIISLPGGCVGAVELAEVSDVAANIIAKYDGTGKSGSRDSSSSNKKKRHKDGSLRIGDLLTVNQLVRVHVMQQVEKGKGKKNDIALSMRSSYINRHLQMKNISEGFTLSGCIASKEDHGYIISVGIANYSFFMPAKNVSASVGELVEGKSYSHSLHSFFCVCVWLADRRKAVGLL